jgi:ABC-type transport system substrate-binding protein
VRWDNTQSTIYFMAQQMAGGAWGNANLVRECPDDGYKVCPGLALSWESNKDFTQWTFKMRDGVRWHDGVPFTAEDAKFWLDVVMFGAKSGDKVRRPAWYKADLGDVQKVEVLDGNRLRVTLARGFPLFLESLSLPHYSIALPRHLVQPRFERGEVDVAPQDVNWVGTGAFKVVKYETGTRTQVRRNDQYWEKDSQGRLLPYLDGMDWAVIADPSAHDAAFRVGRLDVGGRDNQLRLTPERKVAYIRDLGEKVRFAEVAFNSGIGTSLGFNLLKPGPWKDVRVRRAMALWIDKNDGVKGAEGGAAFVGTILNPTNPYTSPDFPTWPGFNPATKEKDRAEAKRLMAEAGYANGFDMKYNCYNQSGWVDRCQFFHAQLAGLDIRLKLVLLDVAAWNESGRGLDYEAYQVSAPINRPFPEATESTFARYSVSPGSVSKHEDPKVGDFFDRVKASSNLEERVRVWREFERYWILEQAYSVPVAGPFAIVAYRSHVKGIRFHPESLLSYLDFATVWMDK